MREHAINYSVPGNRIFLVKDDSHEIVDKSSALTIARDKGLDLVQVSDKDGIPICKLLDYGKFCYEQKKSERKNKKHVQIQKEIKLRIVTQEHDYTRILNRMSEWLGKGFSVKATVVMKGREKNFSTDAQGRISDICTRMKDIADYSRTEANNGSLSVLLHPRKTNVER